MFFAFAPFDLSTDKRGGNRPRGWSPPVHESDPPRQYTPFSPIFQGIIYTIDGRASSLFFDEFTHFDSVVRTGPAIPLCAIGYVLLLSIHHARQRQSCAPHASLFAGRPNSPLLGCQRPKGRNRPNHARYGLLGKMGDLEFSFFPFRLIGRSLLDPAALPRIPYLGRYRGLKDLRVI